MKRCKKCKGSGQVLRRDKNVPADYDFKSFVKCTECSGKGKIRNRP